MSNPKRFRYSRRPTWERPWKPRGPLLPGRSLNPKIQKELRRANHLMAIGQHVNAATMFTDIAGSALDIGIVYPAPMLYIQAAHAYLMGEDHERSLAAASTGLDLLAGQERRARLQSEGERYVEALEAAGRAAEVEQVRGWLADRLQGEPVAEDANDSMPDRCPYCGATMSLEEIRSRRGVAAECQYCGSILLSRRSG
jgi:hypothetical protein